MISWEEIQAYLPTFLSQGSQTAFLDEIKHFLASSSKPFYTSALLDQSIIFQGDGIDGLLVTNLPDPRIAPAPAMVFSNTCDIDPSNERLFDAALTYAPIMHLDRYVGMLRAKKFPEERIAAHERDIRQQLITQIFFLPKGGRLVGDCLVFLDHVSSAASDSVDRSRLGITRLFTLSDFGAWLFALKLSIHFCRVRDRVDRTSGAIL